MSSIHSLRVVADRLTPVAAYLALRRAHEGPSFLLESVVGGERWGRYSILGYRPRRQIVLDDTSSGSFFAKLAAETAHGPGEEGGGSLASRLARAHIGYLSYDLASAAAGIELSPCPEPLAHLLSEMTVVVFDNLDQTVTLASCHAGDLERAREDLERQIEIAELPLPDPGAIAGEVDALMDDAAYEAAVRRAQEYIRAGELSQVVPARTFVTSAKSADAFDVYRALRVLSPSPYMYFLDIPGAEGRAALRIAGASPETLVRFQNETITLRPIAGTRRRGRTAEEDGALEAELLSCPKEREEHEMLVDLAKGELAPLTIDGSVQVPAHANIERYSHVMHIVSEVTGRARAEIGPWDIIERVFPAGTLSGSPKRRAMQIIRALEGRPRGIYGGAIGWIGAGREMDLAIAIRTVIEREGRFEVSAGAGVVEDSVPALEVKETRNKARAALAAIRAARGS